MDKIEVKQAATEESSRKPPPDPTAYPIEYRIDWVRLYQYPDEGELHYDVWG